MPVDFGLTINLSATTPEGATALPDQNRALLHRLAPPISTFWVEDHFQFGETPLLECWTALCTYAAEFPRLRCGTIVMSQSYRNPAMLAKMGAVLQWMTGGRLIFGIGAGWKEDEYRAYGYDYPTPAVRVGQLDEAIQITRAMWTETPASFHGRYYHVANAICTPRPNPLPPILVGGGGEQLTMRVVAKRADWWNLGFRPVEEYARKLAVLREHCDKVGRDPRTLTLTYYTHLKVVEAASEFEPPERGYVLGGTPDKVADELQAFLDLGVRHVMLHLQDFPSPRSLDLFQEQVIPRLNLS